MSRQGKWAAAVAMAILMPLGTGRAQGPDRQGAGRGQFAGMQRVGGVITAIAGLQLTIKTIDGVVYQVVTTDNTRVMRGRGEPGKLVDLKPGDGLMAMGTLDAPNKTLHAAIVMSVDADQVKRMEEARKQELANLGKTLIAGNVTAIDMDNATMTVERPDGISQTIGFDEGTSFRRGRITMAGSGGPGIGSSAASATPTGESITLADIKVGDRVAGPGEVKGGRFIAKQLMVMTPGAGRRRSADGAGAASSDAPTPQTGKAAPQTSPK